MLARLAVTLLLSCCRIVDSQPQPPLAIAAPAAPAVSAVAGVAITVSDLDRAVDFYTTVLSFKLIDQTEQTGDGLERLTGIFGARARTARLRLGEESIELTQFLAASGGEGRPIPLDSRSNDRWFQHIAIVVSDIDQAYAQLRFHNVRHASTGPQTLPLSNPKAGGISAFYFKDPDGHVLELIQFPPGKGDPKWRRTPPEPASSPLFLGVDHTAIVVADTERSLEFYRDRLGLTVAGESENSGTEQEHLNNVFGARLRITSLKAAAGPGIELLEYLAPTDGRAYPLDTRAPDLWNWHTTLLSPKPAELVDALRAQRTIFVSPGLVSGIPDAPAGTAVAQFRDPDGHALYLSPIPRPPSSTAVAPATR